MISIKDYTTDIIVVNDGSTDNTKAILSEIEGIKVISFASNQGKGKALKTGFKYAGEQGYEYAITLDSDGQHLAKDLPNFIDKLEENPGCLIVGARNMDQEHIPGGSSFGHKFSNFWYWVETGIKLPDTQSGYRLYPLKLMNEMKFFTGKYEFEIESIVRAAWKGVLVTSVPVTVIYQEGDERVTHFRPYDFFRISLLNTLLVILALVIFIPLRLFKSLSKENIKKIVKEEIIAANESNLIKATSVAFGFFMGIAPLWGFQLILAIAGSLFFRLNKAIVILTANISVPPMVPVIIYGSYLTGGLFINNPYFLDFNSEITLEAIHNNFMQYFVGAFVLAVVAGLIMGIISFILLTIFRKGKEVV